MDIAALSIVMSQMNTGTQVGMAVTKLSMDAGEQSGQMMADMIKSMELSVNPHVGGNIDIKV